MPPKELAQLITPAKEERSGSVPRVFAVIPVFNRVAATLACIKCLQEQTWPNLTIVVVDGGSTDGTPERLASECPDVVVLTGLGSLWWAGATRRGIDWALANAHGAKDFVLMINNDTLVEPECVSLLVETSQMHGAVVGGVVIDTDNPELVIDGGVTLEWPSYRFHTVKALPADTHLKLDCDVLPGRSTLVPIHAICKVGAVDDHTFPHYIADYEFTHRLKRRAGLNLLVDYRVRVRTRVEASAPASTRQSFKHVVQQASERRSKSNLNDHIRFIWRHAPDDLRNKLVLRLLRAQGRAFIRSLAPIAPQMLVPEWLHSVGSLVRKCRQAAYQRARPLGIWLFRAYLVSAQDCSRHQLSLTELLARDILKPSGYPGYFLFAVRLKRLRELAPEALPLYWFAWQPHRKLEIFFRVRRIYPHRRRGRPTSDPNP